MERTTDKASLDEVLEQDARQAELERLYDLDGRHDPHHAHHATYTGLVAGFYDDTTEQETTDGLTTIGIGTGIAAPARVEGGTASAYRLMRRNGELLLQGAYQWQQGSDGGITWRDIPTEHEITDGDD